MKNHEYGEEIAQRNVIFRSTWWNVGKRSTADALCSVYITI